jgi:RimJ/RimL family protein N-acetyltransferase
MSASRPPTPRIHLRDVIEDDISAFFEHQLDPEATEMAAFPARDRDDHLAHWRKIIADRTIIAKTIVVGDEDVAGNVVSWVQDDHREVGYWIGKPFWGRGIATIALRGFLSIVAERPLYAWVARPNAGSIRVLEKCGFSFDREDRSHLVYRLDRAVPNPS